MSENTTDVGREKLQRVFTYIRELIKIRTPPISNLSTYGWTMRYWGLPSYPTIETKTFTDSENAFDGVVLRVKRPKETACPAPPIEIRPWLENGWEQLREHAPYVNAKNKIDSDGKTITEHFEDDHQRVVTYQSWLKKRSEWLIAENPAREAAEVFNDLFKLQAQIQREAEKYQLYLADGQFIWNSAQGEISHPVLLRKVELEFNSSVPEFQIRETDDELEVYSALLRYHELDGAGILSCKKKLEETEPHPLANSQSVEFFKYFIQRFFSNGRYFGTKEESANCTDPLIYRDPILFLGHRAQGFAESLDKLVEAIPEMTAISEALYRIVGIENKDEPVSTRDFCDVPSLPVHEKSIDFLLTKPANSEQERVISRLEQTGSVLVQGPPGTGKSHTIANIIGHLLASGKTVLISSHTSKALKVVREKVATSLRSLCVSVLDNDLESKAQLEESINGIVSYLSRTDRGSLTKSIDQLNAQRLQLKEKIKSLEIEALEIRKGEYQDVVVAGQATPPSEAARKIAELGDKYGWIPGPVVAGSPIPLDEKGLQWLYQSNGTLSHMEEMCLKEGIVNPDLLLRPTEFGDLVTKVRAIDENLITQFVDNWTHENQSLESLQWLHENLTKCSEILNSYKWLSKAFEDSQLDGPHVEPWINLINQIESTVARVGERSELLLKYGPKMTVLPDYRCLEAAREIVNHFKNGAKLGFFSTVLKPHWKKLIDVCSVDVGKLNKPEHFDAVLALIETHLLRQELLNRWDRQIVSGNGPKLDHDKPEVQARAHLEGLKYATNWKKGAWTEIEKKILAEGFDLAKATQKLSFSGQSKSFLDQFQKLIDNYLIPAISARVGWLALRALHFQKESLAQVCHQSVHKKANLSEYLNQLIAGINENDPNKYQLAYERLMAISGKSEIHLKRLELLKAIESYAPGWASAVAGRVGMHGQDIIPEGVATAWDIRHWQQIIDERLSKDYGSIQRDLFRARKHLEDINCQYVEKLAWRFQIERTGLKEKQALAGWEQLQKKITKTGRGVRDAQLKREARKTLKDCKNAVPVWIMPLSRVFDNFDFLNTKFDVLILDEASQSDITALVAFAIAKQVVVVGDSEQVTPYAVGQELGKIQTLIDEMLQGVPNRMLYDGKTSVYDLAEQSFGETIRLVEHFRCVPNIIQFSNLLSYNGEIKPLREGASSPYSEHLIIHRIDGREENKVNEKEVTEIASIIAAMTEHSAYSNATIGVVSLLGYEQAIQIDSLLRRRLGPAIYSKHKLLCGNASQFQGDERNVMLLSMVNSCDDPPLSIRQTEDFKKTFNVAVSRAQDQLWLIHSLNPSTDLKPGDLRLRLIQHIENPNSLTVALDEASKRSESPFETLVIRDLINAGYRIKPQWEVGAYRIDIVVEGQGKKIAVECDGDKYHPPEKLADDIQRQMVLERLGWTFIRIRGSEYFRNATLAMKRVFKELDSFGIEKLGNTDSIKEERKISGLRMEILRRASEIKQEWEQTPIVEDASAKPRRNRWGKGKVLTIDPGAKDIKNRNDETPNNDVMAATAPKLNFDAAIKNETMRRVEQNFATADHRVFENTSEVSNQDSLATVCARLMAWNNITKKMSNLYEIKGMDAARYVIRLSERGQKIPDDVEQKARWAIERAVSLGFNKERDS